jgi:UDP-glucose:(heptosyl)LPS alpha-1,3-glucosyltransferase
MQPLDQTCGERDKCRLPRKIRINPMPSRPKIAVVIPKYGLVGGAEHFAYEITERLARTTPYEFHVLAHRWKYTEGSPVAFHRIRRLPIPRSIRPWAFAWQVKRTVRAEGFHLVHSHDRIFAADIVSLHCAPHRAWVRDILGKRTSFFDRSTIAVEAHLVRSGLSTTFLPVSSLSMDMFRKEYSGLPGKWQIMHPGVDYFRFSSPERERCRESVRVRHGLPKKAFVVLFAGMNFELKGLDVILESVARARQRLPDADIRLLVVGRGNTEKYQAKAQSLGIGMAVTFTGVVTAGMEEYYRACDTLMILSHFDTFAMVVLEAMAAGLPVIVGPKVGARDIVQHGSSGFVLKSNNDACSSAEYLCTLCTDGKFRQFGLAGSRIAAKHDWEETRQEILRIYRAALASSGF